MGGHFTTVTDFVLLTTSGVAAALSGQIWHHASILVYNAGVIAPRWIKNSFALMLAASRHISWRRRSRPEIVSLAVIALATAVAIQPLWQMGPTRGSDMAMAVYRVFELDRAFHNQVFYPRLGADLNFTYGAPLFLFYPPLASYIMLFYHWLGLGWVTAARAAATGILLASGLGAYGYARWLFADERAGLLSGLAYLLAPYLLTNIHERGAISESLALALLPWLFWTLHRSLVEVDRKWPWLAAGLVAALLLAHNITALFVMPLAAVYVLLLTWKRRAWSRLPMLLAAALLGLGLSAFYWLPALAERDETQIAGQMLGGIYQVDANLTPLHTLIQPGLAFDYTGDLRFHLSLWQALLGGAATAGLLVAPRRLRSNLGLLAGMVVLVLVLQLDASLPFWQGVPLARFIQFPWRLLGIAAFGVAMLLGSALTWPRLAGRGGWIALAGLAAAIICSSTWLLPLRYAADPHMLTDAEISVTGMFERGRELFTPFSDYLPASVMVDSRDLPTTRPPGEDTLPPLVSAPQMRVTIEKPWLLGLQVEAAVPFTLRLHRFYLPGWQVNVDGHGVPVSAGGRLGLVTAAVPAGSHAVTVRFSETPLRLAADILAVLSVLVWLGGLWWLRPRRSAWVASALALLLLAGLLVAHQGLGQTARQPVATPADLGDEVRLLGYDVPQASWRPGDDIPVRLYWLALAAPAGDYHVFLHLVAEDGATRVAQTDAAPVLGFSPTSRWEPGEVIVDEQVLHVDAGALPGHYLLLAGMYRPETAANLTVSGTDHVLPGDRLVLAPIEVTAGQ